jgi:hypothetical protein
VSACRWGEGDVPRTDGRLAGFAGGQEQGQPPGFQRSIEERGHAPEELEHSHVLSKDVRPERGDSLLLRVADQLAAQQRPQASALPSVLDDNGDLGLTGPLVVGVTRDPDELVTWTEGDERHPPVVVHVRQNVRPVGRRMTVKNR